MLKNTDGKINSHSVIDSYDKSSNRILEDIMDETSRPKKVVDEINNIFKMIQNNDVKKAQKKIEDLKEETGDDSDLVRAGVLIKRREIIRK